jgi:hypothetical protein
VSLIGLDGSGTWAAAAMAQAADAVSRAAIDTGGFRFAAVTDIHSPDFLPGGAKYFDLPGMLALAAPRPLWVAGERAENAALIRDAYRSLGQQDQLHLHPGAVSVDAAIDWLTAEQP